MIMLIIPLLVILMSTQLGNAQDEQQQHTPTSSNFQPSLFVVIGVLSFMFSLTIILLIYAKMCHRRPSAIYNVSRNQNSDNHEGMFGNNTRFSGIDKTVVEALPFFRFSSLKGSKQGLECAVCLSEFEEVEILRLLPKCKHGFHIQCLDLWLEHHSTCPLCRQKVSIEDFSTLTNSTRFIIGGLKPDDAGDDPASSSFELFLEREDEEHRERSSRFCIGGSFKKILSASAKKEEEDMHMKVEQGKVLHKHNHQIVVSDVMFKNRWSDVSSSDLMFLNSEMLGVMSNEPFSSSNLLNDAKSVDDEHYRIINIKEEMQKKMIFEHKVGQIKRCNSNSELKIDLGVGDSSEINMNLNPSRRNFLISGEKRSMSEITAFSRFKDLMSVKNKLRQCLADSEVNKSDNDDDYAREDVIKRRKKWFPIAKRTVQWFANREKNRSQQQQQQSQGTSQTLDV